MPQRAEPLNPEELEKKKAEYREYASRFETHFGHVEPTGLATQIERQGFDDSPVFSRLKERLSLSTVIDASSILTVMRGVVTGKQSAFWDLVRCGTITCWAPVQLEKDLQGKFEEISEKLGIPLTQ